MKKLLLIFLLSLCWTQLFATNQLRILDPQRSWYRGQGTIEEAVLSVRPKGVYMEYGLYLTISGLGLGFSAENQYEIEYFFELPEEAIVTDSWLWVGDEIIRGKLLDKWTAAQIYENIVNRRRDPSILFKRDKGQYELRIYPMQGNQSRKVKITFLVPTNWTNSKVYSEIPLAPLRVSRYPLKELHVLTWLDETWQFPSFLEHPTIPFLHESDQEFGDYSHAILTDSTMVRTVNFALANPMKNGVFVGTVPQENNGGFYQLAMLPGKALNLEEKRKVAILFDYDASNSDVSSSTLLHQIKIEMRNRFTEADSFNVLLSNLSDNRISEHWISGDSLAIEIAFGWFNEHSATQYSNLPSLLANGVKFIQENGNWGEILLFTNSDQFGTSAEANQLIEDVVFLMNPRIPIHVIEYQTTNLSYTRIGSRYYYGNEYFNINLARITGGNYVKNFTTNAWQREPLTSILPEAFQLLSTSMHSFDLHTSMGNGFTFSRQNVGTVNDIIFLNDPIIQVGQYSGSFPMNIEISGTINSEVLRQSISVPESDFYASDDFVRTMWAGNYIQSLEQLPETNDIINEIIEYSVQERVISKFTAFLCLEPSRGGEVCYDCMDESSLLPVQEIADMDVDSLRIQVFPNPASSVARIKIQSLTPLKKTNFFCKIHDIRGREIKALNDIPATANKAFELMWDLTNNEGTAVSNGVYFVQIVANGRKYTAKLTVLR